MQEARFGFDVSLVLNACTSVLQVVLTCLPGTYFARKGIVDAPVRRSLSYLALNLMLPLVCIMNIAPQVTASTVLSYWPIAANTIISMGMGGLTGLAGAFVFKTPKHLRYHVVAASAFGNINSLPMMLITSICSRESLPFYASLGGSCSSVGTAYVAMGIAAASLFSYSTANWLLKRRAAPGALLPEGPTSSRAVAGAGACGGKAGSGQQAAAVPGDAAAGSDSDAEQEKGDAVPPLPGTALSTDMSSAFAGTGSRDLHAIEHGGSFRRRTSRVIPGAAAPEGGAAATRAASRMHSVPLDQNGSAVVAEGADHGKQQQQQQQQQRTWRERLAVLSGAVQARLAPLAPAWRVAAKLLPAPMVGSLSGILIGCVAPIKDLLFPQGTAPLGFVTGAINTVSRAFVFTTSLCLGAVLSRGPGPGSRTLGWKTIASVVFIRLVLVPIVGSCIVIGSFKLGIWHPRDPVFMFVMLMQNTVPTANNMQNIASVHRNYEEEMGAMLFWQYMASLIMLPVWMSIYFVLMDSWGLYAPVYVAQ